MSRESVSREALSEWITKRVQSEPDCDGTVVTVKYKLQEPDSDGCNWSTDVSINIGPNATAELIAGILGPIVTEARQKFNIE